MGYDTTFQQPGTRQKLNAPIKSMTPMKLRLPLCAFVAAAIASLLFSTGCSTVPVTGRKQVNFISAGDETKLGLSSFDQLKKETPVNHDPAVNEMVQRVGKRIA